jgi:ribosomal protein S12 methylthiotransferase
MLRAMRRGITGARQRALLDRARERVPGVAIRTTLIAGFPGETDADHAESLALVREGAFDRLGVFAYVREEGTPSFAMPDQVPERVKSERRAELMEAQREVHFARNAAKVGSTLDVLLERTDPATGESIGRTEHDAPDADGVVRVRPRVAAAPGAVVRVVVTASEGYDLLATPAQGTEGARAERAGAIAWAAGRTG